MRTKSEIAKEIKSLEAAKKFVPAFSLFGDDNHAKIDVQIYVLEHELDEDDCAKRYLQEEEPSDEDFEIESCAREASYWLFDGKAAPSADWAHLNKNKKTIAKKLKKGKV